MKRSGVLLAFGLLLIAFLFAQQNNTNQQNNCTKAERIKYENNSFDVFTVTCHTSGYELGMVLNNDEDKKLKSFDKAIHYLKAKGKNVTFMTNGGMYHKDHSPVGLYIENGVQVSAVNTTTNAAGNFFMQPNGIFIISPQKAAVICTQNYNNYKDSILYATQSGPMLVHDGNINSNFIVNSDSRKIRNGVGVNKNGQIIFVISNNEVNFYDFALLFKNQLQCENALYLDGTVSKMYLPALERTEMGENLGTMIYWASK